MQLTENEELLWSGHQSFWSFAPSLVSGILLGAIGVGILIVSPSLPEFVPLGVDGIAAITIVGAALLTIFMYIEYRMHLYAITTEQVYHRSGIVSRNIERVRMEQIQNTARPWRSDSGGVCAGVDVIATNSCSGINKTAYVLYIIF
jgi:membrane-bound ClpP family serine protease